MATTATIKIDRYPRPKAIDRAQRVFDTRFVEKAWITELIERVRDQLATVDHHIQGRDIAGAREVIIEADVELDMTLRCMQGDIPGAQQLADSIAKRSRT